MAIQTYQFGMVLSAKLRRAIRHFLETDDMAKAANLAGIAPLDFAAAMKRPEVKAEVERLEKIQNEANAEQLAKAMLLTREMLDAEAHKILSDKDTSAKDKIRLLEVLYKRFGMLTEKRELTGEGGAPLAFEVIRIGEKRDGQ